jgi:hypothetical protein
MNPNDHFHFDGTYRNNQCSCSCCGRNSEGRKISTRYKKSADFRGKVQQLPNPKTSSRKKDEKEFINHYIHRRKEHHNSTVETVDSRKNYEVSRVTRQTQDQKTFSYIATWHWDAKVLAFVTSKGLRSIPKSMSVEEATKAGLYHAQGGNLYSSVDVKNNQVAIVPTRFDVKEEQKSVKIAEEWYKSNQILQKLAAKAPKRHTRKRTSISPPEQDAALPFTDNASKKKKGPVLDTVDLDRFFRMSKEGQKSSLSKLNHDINNYKQAREEERVELAHLLDAESVIATNLTENKKILESNMKDLSKLKKIKEENIQLKEQVSALQTKGFTRLSLTSKDGVCKRSAICKQLYGFKDFDFMIGFIEAAFEVEYTRCDSDTPYTASGSCKPMTDFEKILLTLTYMNTNWNMETIGVMFGIKSRTTVSSYVNYWLPLLGECGDHMSDFLHFMDVEAFDKLEPASYKELGLRRVAALVDGKDFLTETSRDRVYNPAQASNKMHASAFRLLTWSLPCGAVVERTIAFLARASEKALMNLWGSYDRLVFPVNYLILGDKGFDNTAGCYFNYNTTLHPSFLTNPEFNRDQVNHNVRICQKRYSCEVVYSRVTRILKLSGVIGKESFSHFEAMVGWAHGRANLCYTPLQKL